MRFQVAREFFAQVPMAVFGVVVARGVDNSVADVAADAALAVAVAEVRARFAGGEVKTHPAIVPYREAFQTLGINPNRFPSSIEAMVSRIAKGGIFPAINPVVNLANAQGLHHLVPLGAHDLDRVHGDLQVRFARSGEPFTPFGAVTPEIVDQGEPVYADGHEVRTRRWIWRQGESGKVTEASTNFFFPIDGFRSVNEAEVLAAREALAEAMAARATGGVATYFVDAATPEIEF